MKGIVVAAQIGVRVAFFIQLILGIGLWTGLLLQARLVHIVVGILLVVGLWVLAAAGARSGVALGLVVFGFLWGALVIVFGLTQESIFPDTGHWIVQVFHLLVGISAVALAELIARRIRGTWTPVPVA